MGAPVIIIGGGFSGLLLARLLGDRVLVFEEHSRIGVPEHCTGLISSRTFSMLKAPSNLIEGSYDRLRIVLDEGYSVEIKVCEPILRINRQGIEEFLYSEALSNGSKIVLGRRIRNVNPLKGFVDDIRGDIVVLAEGIRRYFARRLGLIGRGDLYYSLQVRFKGYVDIDFIEVYVTSLSPGFFSWLIPLNDRREGIVGVASRYASNLRDRLNVLTNTLLRLSKIKINRIEYYFGGVFSTGPIGKLGVGRLIAIGDAIGMNKPISGGGLYPITVAAHTLSKIINEYFNGSIDNVVHEYRVELKKLVQELKKSWILSRILRFRGYELIRILARGSKIIDIGDILGSFNYDEHGAWISKILASPAVLRLLATFLAGLLF